MGLPSGYTSAQVIQAVPVVTSSGLTLIATGSLSGSSTAFTNAFSATYDNYKIMISNVANADAQSITLGSSTSSYESSSMYVQSGGTWTGMSPVTNRFYLKDSSANVYGNFSIEIMSPFLSTTTGFTSLATGENTARYMCVGVHRSSTSFTAFTFATLSGTLTGTVRIYGYANS